jgi:hypothetical protein
MTLTKNLAKALLACATISTLYSCKNDDDTVEIKEDPDPIVVVKDTLRPVRHLTEIMLYNQYNDNTEDEKFFDIDLGKGSNDASADNIDLMYCINVRASQKHMLGTGGSTDIATAYSIADKMLHDTRTHIQFYTIKNNFTSTIYDTLKDVRSIEKIFANANTLELSAEKDMLVSDKFGWSEGTVFAFKQASGKRGFIKLNSTPSIILNEKDEIAGGRMVLEIKMEK